MTAYDYRQDFPLLRENKTVYIDNAATAQRPDCVLEAEKHFYETANANPLRGFYPLSLAATEQYEEARKTVQKFIHAKSSKEIIFTRNTTESLNRVMKLWLVLWNTTATCFRGRWWQDRPAQY